MGMAAFARQSALFFCLSSLFSLLPLFCNRVTRSLSTIPGQCRASDTAETAAQPSGGAGCTVEGSVHSRGLGDCACRYCQGCQHRTAGQGLTTLSCVPHTLNTAQVAKVLPPSRWLLDADLHFNAHGGECGAAAPATVLERARSWRREEGAGCEANTGVSGSVASLTLSCA